MNNLKFESYLSEFKQLFRFLLVGGMAAFVDLLISYIIFYIVGLDNYRLCLCYAIADCSGSFLFNKFEEVVSSISFFAGFVFSYLGHANYTFKTGTSTKSLCRLLFLAIINVMLRASIISAEKLYGIDGYLSIVISLVIVTAISYAVSKYWVFKT